jgi:hypothetical protein
MAMTGSGAHPATFSVGSGSKAAGVWGLWLHVVPRLRMGGAVTPLPQYAYMDGMCKDQFTI